MKITKENTNQNTKKLYDHIVNGILSGGDFMSPSKPDFIYNFHPCNRILRVLGEVVRQQGKKSCKDNPECSVRPEYHPLSFREIKQKDRIIPDIDDKLFTNISDIWAYNNYFFETFSVDPETAMEFDFILDDFVVLLRIGEDTDRPINMYMHIHKKDGFCTDSDDMIFMDFYMYDRENGFQPMLNFWVCDFFSIFYLSRIMSPSDEFSHGYSYNVPFIEMIANEIYIPVVTNDTIVSTESLWDVSSFMNNSDLRNACLLEAISIIMLPLAVNYNVQLQLDVLSKRRNAQTSSDEKINVDNVSSSIPQESDNEELDTDKKPSVVRKQKDGSRVIDLRNISLQLKSKESVKRVKQKARKACDYQYSVAGHFRHYKSGKVVYIKSHNRNTDKPFKGKTILI